MKTDKSYKGRIIGDSSIHFGKPCIANIRIPVESVLELVEENVPFDEIITRYYPELDTSALRRFTITPHEHVSFPHHEHESRRTPTNHEHAPRTRLTIHDHRSTFNGRSRKNSTTKSDPVVSINRVDQLRNLTISCP